MKRWVLLMVFLLYVNVSYAVFSMHARITPDVEENNNLHIKVEPIEGEDSKVKVTVAPIGTTWLFVCAKPLPAESQDFREYIWYKKGEGKDIVEEKILFTENDYREARKKPDQGKNDVITFVIDREKLERAYIHRDFPYPIHDGGLYYTVDLSTYISSSRNSYFEIAQKRIKELGMDVENMECRDKTAEWKDFLQKRGKDGEWDNLSQKLADTDFVAVYCGPKDLDVLGGDINIFIDRITDEIMDVLRGQ